MLRISEIKLPLDHPEDALRAAIVAKLQISDDELKGFTIFKRSYDARRKSAIVFVYIVDVETAKDAELLKKFQSDPHVSETPDSNYKIVARAPEGLKVRPIVIGTGPCGLFAGLMLARMGFRPVILERGKSVRERSKDTFGFWRDGGLKYRIERAVRRRRRGNFFRRQTLFAGQRLEISRSQSFGRIRRSGRKRGNSLHQQTAHRHL